MVVKKTLRNERHFNGFGVGRCRSGTNVLHMCRIFLLPNLNPEAGSDFSLRISRMCYHLIPAELHPARVLLEK